MQSEGNANHFVSIGINFGILLVSIWPTWIILSELEHGHEIQIESASVDGEGGRGGDKLDEAAGSEGRRSGEGEAEGVRV
jgi:hypothetical protein